MYAQYDLSLGNDRPAALSNKQAVHTNSCTNSICLDGARVRCQTLPDSSKTGFAENDKIQFHPLLKLETAKEACGYDLSFLVYLPVWFLETFFP